MHVRSLYDSRSNTNSELHTPGIKKNMYSGNTSFFVNSNKNTPAIYIPKDLHSVSTQKFQKYSQNEDIMNVTQDMKLINTDIRHSSNLIF